MFSRYWDYNHLPVATIIALAKRGVCGHLASQPIFDVVNEAKILLTAANQASPETLETFDQEIGKIAQALAEQQELYVEQRQEKAASSILRAAYQISIAGNGPLYGEVGHLIPIYPSDSHDPDLHP